MSSKFRSFGWDVKEIDGHDHEQIEVAMQKNSTIQPLLIVAHTIKGKGFKAMENNPEWHHKTPSESDLLKFLEEIA
jgi:transketolase